MYVTGMTGARPSLSGAEPKQRFEFLPTIRDGIDVGHVGHGAAGGKVRQNDRLLWPRKYICGFRHEVHAAKDNCFSIWPRSSLPVRAETNRR